MTKFIAALALVGARPPVAFFAYPGAPSLLAPADAAAAPAAEKKAEAAPAKAEKKAKKAKKEKKAEAAK